MRNNRVRRITLTAMLFALAIALGFLESLVAPLLGLPPGVKLGLSNVVVMFALFFLTKREALLLVVLKGAFAFLTRGAMAGIFSTTGGLVSLGIMLLLMLPRRQPSMLLLSVAGALGHNLGQFVMVRILLGPTFVYYAPVLLISGVAMGALTAGLLRVLLPALQKSGLVAKQKPTPPDKDADPSGGDPT